ncbi:MAG: cytochrome c biogenesis protein CcdA [Bacteroidota bacterium]|nr:cytochrome c biogenesis protein CcdA [Bacteroidota bacterium]
MRSILRYIAPFALLCAVLAAALTSRATDPKRIEPKLHMDSAIFKMKLEPKAHPQAGKTFQVRIHVDLRHPYHIWSSYMSDEGGLIPLSLQVPDAISKYFEIVGKLTETGKIIPKYDSGFEMVTKAHHTPFDVIATIKVKANSKDPVPFSLFLKYQTCNETQCLPPAVYVVPMDILGEKPLMLTIAEGTPDTTSENMASAPRIDSADKAMLRNKDSSVKMSQSSPGASSQPPSSPGGGESAAKGDVVAIAQDSIWSFIFAAMGFGFLALLTPCVFPMVPITVSFFTKRNAGSRKEATKDALLYATGIVVTFVLLGFFLSLIAGPAGINQFAANPWANLAIAAIFIAFALNLFGLFEIGIPSSVLSKLNMTAQKSKNKVFSVVLMGFVFSLTSFTCTVPFVGTLMVTFSRGSWFVPLIGMVAFATIFALPFFLLALFPNLMKQLPRSGTWMNNVKVVMGFLEIAAALKFFSNVDLIWSWHFFNRDLVLAAWVAIAIMTTIYLLGRFQLSHDTPVEHIGALRLCIAVMFLSAGIYLYTGFHNQPLGDLDAFLPPASEVGEVGANMASMVPSQKTATQSNQPQSWIPSYPAALAEAKKTGKNIFIDFTGYTCTNCRAMEASVFSRPDVKEMFGSFVLARLYTDNGTSLNDSNRDLEESRFNTIALPYYVIVSPDDKPLATVPGFTRDVESFKAFLKVEKPASATSVAMLGR